MRQVRASVERAYIPEKLRPLCFRQNRYFFSCVKFGQRLSIGTWREAQSQPAPRRLQRAFNLHARKFDFVSITPGEAGLLIATRAMTAQRTIQREVAAIP